MIDKMAFFLKVVRCQSFNGAAREQGISSGAASRWIYELEKELGVTLLKRSTRKIVPSEAGLLLYKRFESIYDEINDLTSDVQDLAHGYRGHMKIASTPMFANLFLKNILGKFMRDNPGLQVTLILTPFDVDLMEYDFAIRAEAWQEGLKARDVMLVRRLLWRDRLCVCATPKYVAAFGAPTIPEDLKSHRCLFSRSLVTGGNHWVFTQGDDITSIKLLNTLECDSAELLHRFVLDDIGIAYLPESLVANDIIQGALSRLLVPYTTAYFDFNLYWQPNRHQSHRNKQFHDILLSEIKDFTPVSL